MPQKTNISRFRNVLSCPLCVPPRSSCTMHEEGDTRLPSSPFSTSATVPVTSIATSSSYRETTFASLHLEACTTEDACKKVFAASPLQA
ncbi:hypothetical protein E2C01_068205 [Portunus trituberculatus]|uniref:Uncharacterized protein n=1 Tax=Portunus trituberculatus TaxID=210409 RepID=A0A5B7HVN5_PORTR|nr:hypothetical protein [Portunus trituberculatus]